MGLKELVPAGKLFLTDRNLFQERERTEQKIFAEETAEGLSL